MKITTISQSKLSELDFNNIAFGKNFTDYMLVSDYDGAKWSEISIEPLKSMELHPATSVLHYGQAIFEGLKAYKTHDGKVNIFRLKDNISRMNVSATRMNMPKLDEEIVFQGIKEFVRMQKDWVPEKKYGSLYIRPFMVATDETLRALTSRTYKLMVIASPVGFYYSTPLNIYLEKRYRRAATGGVGYAKAAGNYAASFYPTDKVREDGFDQILWTDITNDYSLEELGSANFFFLKKGVLYTPEIHDSILKGITRDTVIRLANSANIVVKEEKITTAQFVEALQNSEIECMFATGTAAAITYVNTIAIDGRTYQVDSNMCTSIQQIENELNEVKYLNSIHDEEWNVIV